MGNKVALPLTRITELASHLFLYAFTDVVLTFELCHTKCLLKQKLKINK